MVTRRQRQAGGAPVPHPGNGNEVICQLLSRLKMESISPALLFFGFSSPFPPHSIMLKDLK